MTGFVPHIYFGLDPMLVATAILCVTYAVIIWDKLNRAIVALVGAAAAILVGALDQNEALRGIDWNTIGLLAGMMILESISRRSGMFQYLAIWSAQQALPYVLFHHERWDGRGYPSGRSGVEIPEEARLLAVVDAFDAMTSTRPYRRALPTSRALAEIERCAGTQFDPTFASALLYAWDAGVLTDAAAI